MKTVIDVCIETDDIYLLTNKLQEIFLSSNIIPHDQVDYQFKQTITRAIRNNSLRYGRNSTRPTSILFLAADPTDASRLRLGEEFREIHEKLKLAQLRDRFKLELPQLSIRPADISQALLDTEPQIVHFSGHGTSAGALCFEDQAGQIQLVQPDALAALFEQFANLTSCVILNACYSETQAKAIAKHIKYVIGMRQEIDDKAAIAFAIGFYQALGAGRTIENAYKLGCVQIRLQGVPEHLTPVLFHDSTSQSKVSIREVAEKIRLPDEILEKLSRDANSEIRLAVAKNTDLPNEILERLARDANSHVRLAVAKNPHSPSEILKRFADDPSDEMKTAVLAHDNCPEEILLGYVEHGDYKIHKFISERRNLPQAVIDRLAEKKRQALEKHEFRKGICSRCGCTPEFVEYFESGCVDS